MCIIHKHDFICVDINECQTDNGGCTQTCDNTDGSYQCSCWKGYELNDDNHTCVGKIIVVILDNYVDFSEFTLFRKGYAVIIYICYLFHVQICSYV